MNKIQFNSNAESLCKIARNMLWNSNKDVEDCIDIVKGLLINPDVSDIDTRNLAIEILEGRKILKGTTIAYIEDDNENVRSMSLLLVDHKEYKTAKLEEHMKRNSKLYIDTAVKGLRLDSEKLINATMGEVINYRLYGSLDYNSRKFLPKGHLKNGTYLLTNAELSFDILGGLCNSNEEVVNKCTNYFNEKLTEWKLSGLTYEKMDSYQKEIYNRNLEASNADLFPFDTKINMLEKEDALVTHEFSDFETFDLEDDESNFKENYASIGTPDPQDNYFSEHGWLDLEGNYYSTNFGGHLMKAWYIVKKNPILEKEFNDFYNQYKSITTDRYDLSAAFLESQGWGRFMDQQQTGMSTLIFSSKKEITELQIDACLKMKNNLNLSYNPYDYYDRFPTAIRGVNI
jgi:hypothetical protein